MSKTNSCRWNLIICLLLTLLAFAPYAQVRHFEFNQYDDVDYVTKNPMVLQGLTGESVGWAMTTTYFSYWHPLTWLSHMLDVELFGLNAGAHHLTNVFLHIIASLALFLGLKRLTGHREPSAFVAALFALHPLHVESVAWVAERKDVLSTLFWFLTLWAYAWYTERPGKGRYVAVLGLFGLGLMSKPMLVTVPCVLLLLDLWPLRRLRLIPDQGAWFPQKSLRGWWATVKSLSPVSPLRLIMEKVPLLLMAILSSAITFIGVYSTNRMLGTETVSISLRLANVPISYVRYLYKMVVPENMVIIHPMPDHWPLWMVLGSTILLLGISWMVLRLTRRAPYLLVGWLWYLGTLVPTIGIIPVGWHSIADRYTYVPLVGIFIMVAWGIRDWTASWPVAQRKTALLTVTSLIMLGCIMGTWLQNRHWRNTETLFRHAVNVSTNNSLAHYNLGLTLHIQGRYAEAAKHYEETIRINPGRGEAHNNLGLLLNTLGRHEQATNILSQALQITTDNKEAWLNYGISLQALGKPEKARELYERALELDSEYGEAHAQMGALEESQGNLEEALNLYFKAVMLNANMVPTLNHLSWLLATMPEEQADLGDAEEALRLAEQSCALTRSQDPSGLMSLAAAQLALGHREEALSTLQQAMDRAAEQGQVALMERCRSLQKEIEEGGTIAR